MEARKVLCNAGKSRLAGKRESTSRERGKVSLLATPAPNSKMVISYPDFVNVSLALIKP